MELEAFSSHAPPSPLGNNPCDAPNGGEPTSDI